MARRITNTFGSTSKFCLHILTHTRMESKQDTLTVPVYNHQKDPEGDSPDAKSAIQLVDGSIKPSYTNRHILVGGAITILKNMSASMGRMTSHI